jgi:hypothetical protein
LREAGACSDGACRYDTAGRSIRDTAAVRYDSDASRGRAGCRDPASGSVGDASGRYDDDTAAVGSDQSSAEVVNTAGGTGGIGNDAARLSRHFPSSQSMSLRSAVEPITERVPYFALTSDEPAKCHHGSLFTMSN